MKLITLCIFSLLGLMSIKAQNLEADAIKFGTNNNEGSARFVSLGGAMSAVGGDISTFNYNPAGIAVYKSSVAIVSPSLESYKSNAILRNSSFQNGGTKFNISNIGISLYLPSKKFGVLKNFNIGIALNNQNSFNQKNEFRQNTENSVTRNWLNEIKSENTDTDGPVGYDKFSFEAVGAYFSYLVNFDSSILEYTSPITQEIHQKGITNQSGNKRDFNIALGANLLDKFYIGAAISVPLINYKSTLVFKEEDRKNINGDFEDFTQSNQYENAGAGLNAKIGIIYKPIHEIRLSAGIESQTRYQLTEEYTTDFTTNFEDVRHEHNSSLGKFSYTLNTPWRANAGIALVHRKVGLISFDYELVDYQSTKFVFEDEFSELAEQLNKNINKKYQIAHNFKVGAEAKIKKFRIRAGYNMQTSPIKSQLREGENDFSRQQFSGGVGYLWKRISLDAAYRYSMSRQYELSYDGINGIAKNTDSQLFVVSVAFKLSK